jgi:hypothetical protein
MLMRNSILVVLLSAFLLSVMLMAACPCTLCAVRSISFLALYAVAYLWRPRPLTA